MASIFDPDFRLFNFSFITWNKSVEIFKLRKVIHVWWRLSRQIPIRMDVDLEGATNGKRIFTNGQGANILKLTDLLRIMSYE